jgi:biotin synthase
LHARAQAVRNEVFGPRVFVRGVLEVSNFCRENCSYCGMRRDNKSLHRYRLKLDTLRDLIRAGLPEMITDLNIQTGEDVVGVREVVLPLIEFLRQETNLGISVCLGTLDFKIYDELRQAGASYYIIKMETGNRAHYADIHAPGTFDERLEAIQYLARTGWAVSSGFILGLPGQTREHVEESIDLLSRLPLAGASVSPFIAGEQTPFDGHASGPLETTLDCIARLRLRNPSYIIPAVSALNLVGQDGYVRALKAGANLATINLTPTANRTDYVLYKRDRFIMHENRVRQAIEAAGCTISLESIADTWMQYQGARAVA